MKHPKSKKAPTKTISDVTTRYQVSRSLPDLREGPQFDNIKQRSGDGSLESQFGNRPKVGDMNGKTTIGEPRVDGKKVKKDKKPRSWKKILKRTFLVLLAIFLIVTGWLGYKAYKNSGKLGTNIFSIFDNSKLKGENEGHVNILLAGNSADDPGHGGAQLTDSIILVSINTRNKTAFLLSIPRDLYVQIPDNGYSKINAAYVYGEQQKFSEAGYPGGGMGLLSKVVSTKLDVPIDYYALINYTAFKDAVNAVGGITITLNSPDPRGVYDPYANLKLGNGTISLSGQQALNLARARGDGPGSYGIWQGDFDRALHQRQMLIALRAKATSAGVIANPVKIGNLFDAAGNNIKTDLSLGNMRRLNTITKDIPDSKIKSASLNSADGVNLLRSYRTTNGQSALVPAAGLNDYTAIQAYVVKLIGPTTTSTSR